MTKRIKKMSISELKADWKELKRQFEKRGERVPSFDEYLESYSDYIGGLYDEY